MSDPTAQAVFERIVGSDLLADASGRLLPGEALHLTGVWGAAPAVVAAALGRRTARSVLLVCPHLDDADAAVDDIEMFAGFTPHLLPAWEAQLAEDHVSEEVTGERLRLLNLLAQPPGERDEEIRVVVAPAMALLQPVPTREALAAGRLRLRRTQEQNVDDLLTWLTDAGYEHTEQVDRQGEFAHRGGIVDVFPPGANEAVRVEFFGDEIDSLRSFDLDTQRSERSMEHYDLPSLTVGRALGEPGDATHFLSYLPDDAIVALPEPADLRDLAGQLYDRIRDDLADSHSPVALRPPEEIFDAMSERAVAEMHLFAGRPSESAVSLGIRSLQRLSLNTAEALAELEELSETNEIWVFCDNEAEQKRFARLLAERHPKLHAATRPARGHLSGGFHWPALGFVAVGHAEIYHRYAKVRRIRKVRTGRPIESLLDLREGDYVVHVGHGIAKFEGLRKMDRDGVQEEYLTLRFAQNAVLHVPAAQINLVQKYVGAGGKRPSLSKLGGRLWQRTKAKVSEAVRDLAAEMLRIQAMREASPGMSYPVETEMQRQFAEEFLYTETEDQLTAMGQIDADMNKPRPMDRLLCGDVGYGKTELAMRAAMKVVEAGRQVAVLVPTTVLADQHDRTFRERFADYPVRVEMLSRFRTPARQKEIVRRLRRGEIDILIGTHRLLSRDVHLPDLGLVVIDEEQRFGVAAKEHLKSMRANVDVLTLTATPIPRTLHMALLGLRDISSLATPPMDRRAIATEVVPEDDRLIRTAILREMNRGGQCFFVHNRVQDIRSVARHVQDLVPDARIAIGHGQMHERSLEKVMLNFVRGEIDVLVCTTIIESGLDIPTANTMLIHEADRYGLSELHQLRGRVGRYKHRAFCYLLLPRTRSLSPVAAKRLKAIEDFSDLGAGFQIAMRDLEIRGAGNILGPQQSGHIAMVGYELYCQLLEQAVRRLRGEEAPPTPDVHVELGVEAFLPKNYIPSERQRMEVYRRLVCAASTERLEQLRADLADAFGRPPEEAERLLDVAEVRIHAGRLGIRSILKMPPDIIFRVADHKKAQRVFDGAAGSVRLPDAGTVHWRPPGAYLEMPTLLRVLLKRMREANRSALPPKKKVSSR